MKERPILFKDEMIRAILEGRKTQTRRVIKPQPLALTSDGLPFAQTADDERFGRLGKVIACPYGQSGDQLWVRETFAEIDCRLTYKADSNDGAHCVVKRWIPSLHMPRWASRITLEITSVHVERLQDISESDVLAEGVGHPIGTPLAYGSVTSKWNRDREFAPLWEKINGPSSWNENPWVWVVEFKRVSP